MPDFEFNNKILILLRQAKGKSGGNTLARITQISTLLKDSAFNKYTVQSLQL